MSLIDIRIEVETELDILVEFCVTCRYVPATQPFRGPASACPSDIDWRGSASEFDGFTVVEVKTPAGLRQPTKQERAALDCWVDRNQDELTDLIDAALEAEHEQAVIDEAYYRFAQDLEEP